MKTRETIISGLLTDYALEEIQDPEVVALVEELLDSAPAHQQALEEIRQTVGLVRSMDRSQVAHPDAPNQSGIRFLYGRQLIGLAASLVVTVFLIGLMLNQDDEPPSESEVSYTVLDSFDRNQAENPGLERLSRRGGDVPWNREKPSYDLSQLIR